MAVIKYKMTKREDGRRAVPGYVEDRGHWGHADGHYVGWADLGGKFYIDSSNATSLSKSDFVTYATPMNQTDSDQGIYAIDLEDWYDTFVTKNS